MRKIIFIFSLLLLSTSCSNQNDTEKDNLTIYTSIYPIQYVAENIVGDVGSVQSIYPPGVDAHTYEPTTKQLTNIAKSDLFIYLGAGMESFAERTEEALQMEDTNFLEIGEEKKLFTYAENSHHDYDPHIWFDPIRMIRIGEIIKDSLVEMYPDEKETFQTNFSLLEDKLNDLDNAFTQTLSHKKDAQIIVTHAAYQYWEERYGIEQLSISGISSSDEPSQKELIDLVKEANKLRLHYIVFEKNSSNSLGTIIQDHLQATDVYIHNLETLTEEDIEEGNDYESIMYDNLDVLDKITN